MRKERFVCLKTYNAPSSLSPNAEIMFLKDHIYEYYKVFLRGNIRHHIMSERKKFELVTNDRFFQEYFISVQEFRKLKLKKINEKSISV